MRRMLGTARLPLSMLSYEPKTTLFWVILNNAKHPWMHWWRNINRCLWQRYFHFIKIYICVIWFELWIIIYVYDRYQPGFNKTFVRTNRQNISIMTFEDSTTRRAHKSFNAELRNFAIQNGEGLEIMFF